MKLDESFLRDFFGMPRRGHGPATVPAAPDHAAEIRYLTALLSELLTALVQHSTLTHQEAEALVRRARARADKP